MHRFRVRRVVAVPVLAAVAVAVVIAWPASAPGPTPPLLFGSNGLAYSQGPGVAIKKTGFSRLTGAGMNLLRVEFSWAEIQPTKSGGYDWSDLDRTFDALPDGVKVMAMFNNSPGWARDPDLYESTCHSDNAVTCRMPPDSDHLDDWRAFVRAALQRYGTKITAVELWNEPNFISFFRPRIDPAAWAHLALAAAQTAKDVLPSVITVSGGMVGGWDDDATSAVNAYNFIQRAVAAEPDLPKWIDMYGTHPYSRDRCGTAGADSWAVQRAVSDPCSTVPVDLQTMRWTTGAFDPDAKIAVTEFGYHTEGAYKVTQEQQRDWLLEAYDYYAGQPDIGMFVIHSLFDPPATSDDEASYGMVTADNTPKLAWTAFHDRFNPDGGTATSPPDTTQTPPPTTDTTTPPATTTTTGG